TLKERSTAQEVMQRLDDGELFEELARQFSTGPEGQSGGYVGGISTANMPIVFAVKLAGVESFSPPLLLESGGSYHVVQRIAPFDPELWQQKISAEKSVRRQKTAEYAVRPVAVKKSYLLLSGVFRNHDYADQRVARLLKLGMKSYLQPRGDEEHQRYEVIAGRFDRFEAAEEAGAQLKQAGLDYYIRKEK
ncbi:MAG: SPOR domain-containing protein, partial [Desulfuromonas sp.]|nr:SPOR domain-containing protein [Desulfuromonas sp.]